MRSGEARGRNPARRLAVLGVLALWAGLGAGCVGVLADDGTSVSLGHHGRGALWRGRALAPAGPGYAVPEAWRPRKAQYATEELATLLTRAFATMERLFPGSKAALGDLSRKGGGQSREHSSHHNGRDADIFFYAVDERGRPYRSELAMLQFGADGWAKAWSPPKGGPAPSKPVPKARFDTRRNWALVRTLLLSSDSGAHLQWIFIHAGLKALLLDEARGQGEPEHVIVLAEALLHQPGDSAPHDDHLHVRVFCDPRDRALGCEDRGPVRWLKKHWKRLGPNGSGVGDDEAEPTLVAGLRSGG